MTPHYPVTVRPSLPARVSHVLNVVLLLFVCVMAAFLMLGALNDDWMKPIWMMIPVLAAIYVLWDGAKMLTHSTRYDMDGVTTRDMFGEKRLSRVEIESWQRTYDSGGLGRMELWRKGEDMRTPPFVASIPKKKPDPAVEAWFQGLTDLQAQTEADNLREVRADDNYGHTPEERVSNAKYEQGFIRALTLVGLASLFWLALRPEPYWLALAASAAFPVLVVLLTIIRRDRWRLDRGGEDLRPQTGLLILYPSMGLAWRAMNDWRVVDDWWLTGGVIAAGAVLVIIVAVLVRETMDNWKAITWFFVAAIYAYGVILPANIWFDRAQPQRFQVEVVDKLLDDVTLAPWGPIRTQRSEEMGTRTVEQINVGDRVCVSLYPGALGIRTYSVARCVRAPNVSSE